MLISMISEEYNNEKTVTSDKTLKHAAIMTFAVRQKRIKEKYIVVTDGTKKVPLQTKF